MPYFGINIAVDADQFWPNDVPRVCTDMHQLQTALKLNRSARFKQFRTHAEAEAFSRLKLVPTTPGGNGSADAAAAAAASSNQWPVAPAEKPSPYATPSRDKCQSLRSAIECGNNELVARLVADNPRLLINSGDTPTLLREGARENALHVAAARDRAAICRQLLNLVSDWRTFVRLYPEDSRPVACMRAERMLDLFLNMPTKVSLETPLHIAAKRGHAATVAALVQYTVCRRSAVDKHNQTPLQACCQRYQGGGDVDALRRRIAALLDEPYYVPVLCDPNSVRAAYVGVPCSLSQLQPLAGQHWHPQQQQQQQKCYSFRSVSSSGAEVSTGSAAAATATAAVGAAGGVGDGICGDAGNGHYIVAVSAQSPRVLAAKSPLMRSRSDSSVLSSPLAVSPSTYAATLSAGMRSRAWAGPMSRALADEFFRRWRCLGPSVTTTTAASSSNGNSSVIASASGAGFFDNDDRGGGSGGGANSDHVPRSFHSPVSAFAAHSLPNSPARCAAQARCDSVARRVRVSDPDKGLERIGRALAVELRVPWTEYWPFLRQYANLRSPAGLAALDQHLSNQQVALLTASLRSGAAAAADSGGVDQLVACVSRRLDEHLQTGSEMVDRVDSDDVISLAAAADSGDADKSSQPVVAANDSRGDCLLSPLSALCHQLDRMRLTSPASANTPVAHSSSSSNNNSSCESATVASVLSLNHTKAPGATMMSPLSANGDTVLRQSLTVAADVSTGLAAATKYRQSPPLPPLSSLSSTATGHVPCDNTAGVYDDNDDDDCFYTPPASASLSVSPLDGAITPPEPPATFINGGALSRIDIDVYRALCRERCCIDSTVNSDDNDDCDSDDDADDDDDDGPASLVDAACYPAVADWMSHIELVLAAVASVDDSAGGGSSIVARGKCTPATVARALLLATPKCRGATACVGADRAGGGAGGSAPLPPSLPASPVAATSRAPLSSPGNRLRALLIDGKWSTLSPQSPLSLRSPSATVGSNSDSDADGCSVFDSAEHCLRRSLFTGSPKLRPPVSRAEDLVVPPAGHPPPSPLTSPLLSHLDA